MSLSLIHILIAKHGLSIVLVLLLARLTRPISPHRLKRAGHDFLGCILLGSGCGSGHAGVVGADDAALFLLDFAGGFFDVGGAAGAEVISGLETLAPGGTVHVLSLIHIWLTALLDKQDSGQTLTDQERAEAEGLVDLADTLTYLGLKARAAA